MYIPPGMQNHPKFLLHGVYESVCWWLRYTVQYGAMPTLIRRATFGLWNPAPTAPWKRITTVADGKGRWVA